MPMPSLAETEPIVPPPSPPVAPNVPATEAAPLSRGATALSRSRPEYDPLGYRFGEYFFYPRIGLDESYDDNIFAANVAAEHDFITAVSPAFDLKSNFGANALNLSAGAVISQYAIHHDFDTEDAFANVNGRLDLGVGEDLHGTLRVARQHEDPGAPNVPGAIAQPIEFMTYSGDVGVEDIRSRIGYAAGLSAIRSEYEAVPLIGGGLLPQSDQNNFTYSASLEGNYEFTPNYRGFVRGSVNYQDYDHAALGAAIRTSYGYHADSGIRIDLTGLIFLDAYVGYMEQDYQVTSLGTVSGVDTGATVAWNVTQVTSLSLKAERSIQNAPASVVGTAPAPAYVQSTAGVNVDHELFRNVLLNGHFTFGNYAFQGIDRTDYDYLAGAGVKYLLSRYLYLGANYSIEHRDSTGTAAITPFTRDIVMLRLSSQL